MAFKVTIGQYYNADSLLHRLDPRLKLSCIFIFMVLVFLAQSPFTIALTAAFLIACMAISKIPFKLILGSIKPIAPFMLITALLNLFFIKTGETLFQWAFITITNDGLFFALIISVRFFFLMLGGSLVALCTSPISLCDAAEDMLKPFKRFGLPAHEISMMLSIALRFIPTLAQEADRIMKAQMVRGAAFDEGNLIKRARVLIPLIVPLFASAIQHAENLAVAMDARCYEGGDNRSHYHQLMFMRRDLIALIVFAVYAGLLLSLKFMGL